MNVGLLVVLDERPGALLSNRVLRALWAIGYSSDKALKIIIMSWDFYTTASVPQYCVCEHSLVSGQQSTTPPVHKSPPSGFAPGDKLLVNSALWPPAVTSAYHALSYQSEAKTLCTFSNHAFHSDVKPPPQRWTFHRKLEPAWQTLFQQLLSGRNSMWRLKKCFKGLKAFPLQIIGFIPWLGVLQTFFIRELQKMQIIISDSWKI